MNVPTWLPVLAMAVGIIAVLRATAIVATKGEGRFPADVIVTSVLGFGLLVAGQYLLQR